MAEWWITEQETGGMMQLEGHCTKTGDRMMEVLRTKNMDTSPPSAASLDTYTGRPLELVPVDRTEDTVTEIAGRLSRGAMSGGTDLVSLQE